MRPGRTTTIHFGSQVVKSVAGFIATLAIARFLGPSTLGIYAVSVAVVAWIVIPPSAITSAVTKRVSEGEKQGAYLSAGYVMSGVLALVLFSLVGAFDSHINSYVGDSVSGLIAMLLVGTVFFQTTTSSLSGLKKVAESGLLQATERMLRTVVQIALIFLGFEIAGLLAGHAGSLVVLAVFGLLLFDVRPTRFGREHIRSLLAYARYSWLGRVESRTFAWMDTLVLAFFVQSALIGIYEVAWSLASVFALVSISIRQTLFPELSKLGAGGEYDRIRHFLNEGLVFTGVFGIPGLFGAAVVGHRVLKIYSPEFMQGATILLLLVLARLLAAYGRQFVGAINAIDRPDVAFRISLAFIVVNLILNVVLVYRFGWHGAAVATVVSAALILTLGYFALARLIGNLEIPYDEIIREIVASGMMAAGVFGLSKFVPPNHYATVGLVFVGGGLYAVVLLAISTRIRRKTWSLVPLTLPD